MSAVSFRSVFMVASCAGAALGCYLVSLRVASERAALEDVETKIVLAQRDIRVLQTEIGTRGRLAQLERWNVKVMAMSAPTVDQFLKGGFELARFTAPERKTTMEAPVVLASAPAPDDSSPALQPERPSGAQRQTLMHEASLKTAPRPNVEVSLAPREPQKTAEPKRAAPKTVAADKAASTATATKAPAKTPAKEVRAASSTPKVAGKTKAEGGKVPAPKAVKVTKPAARDPLAPLAEPRRKVASLSKAEGKPIRESARKQ